MKKEKIQEILEKEMEEIPYIEGAMRYMINYHNSNYRDILIYKAFKRRIDDIVERRKFIANELGIKLRVLRNL